MAEWRRVGARCLADGCLAEDVGEDDPRRAAEVSSEHPWEHPWRGVRPLVAVCGVPARRVGYFGHPWYPRRSTVDCPTRRTRPAALGMQLDGRVGYRWETRSRAEGLADDPLR